MFIFDIDCNEALAFSVWVLKVSNFEMSNLAIFFSAESLYILKIHLCSKQHEFWMKNKGVITKTRFWKMSKKWTLRELCS